MRNSEAARASAADHLVHRWTPCAIAGALLVVVGFAVLAWDAASGRPRLDALEQLAHDVRPAPIDAIDPLLDGSPVHVRAVADATGSVSDPVFAVGVDALALYRHVEMYQWLEFEHVAADGTQEWRYASDWDEAARAQLGFRGSRERANPAPAFTSEWFVATDAHLGPYPLADRRLLERALQESRSARTRAGPATLGNWPRELTLLPETNVPGFVHRGERYLRTTASEGPTLGDLRVSYVMFPRGQTVSVVGRQRDGRLDPWTSSDGAPVFLAGSDALDAAGLIDVARSSIAPERDPRLRTAALIGVLLGTLALLPVALTRLQRFKPLAALPATLRVVIVLAAALLAALLALVAGRLWMRIPLGLLLALVLAAAASVFAFLWRRQVGSARASRVLPTTADGDAMRAQAAAALELAARRRARLAAIRALTVSPAAARARGYEQEADLPQRNVASGRARPMPASVPLPPQARSHSPALPAHGARAHPAARTQNTRTRQMRQLLDAGIPTVVPQSSVVRRCVATRGEWTLNRIARIERSSERVVGFELLRDGIVVKRGSELEVRRVLRESAARASVQ